MSNLDKEHENLSH